MTKLAVAGMNSWIRAEIPKADDACEDQPSLNVLPEPVAMLNRKCSNQALPGKALGEQWMKRAKDASVLILRALVSVRADALLDPRTPTRVELALSLSKCSERQRAYRNPLG
jgi:hypothetical protein